MEKVKLVEGGYGRFRIQSAWHYWVQGGDAEISKMEGEGYWDSQAQDFNAENPYYESGQEFVVLLGKPGNFKRAVFVVVGLRRIMKQEPTVDNPRPPSFKRPVVKRVSDWITYMMDTPVVPVPVAPSPKYVSSEGEVKWNPGLKKHQVLVDGNVVFESQNKEEAIAVASGSKELAA